MRARPRRRGLPKDDGDRLVASVSPNILDRAFEASAPNQKWVADFTYIWTAEGWLYVAAVDRPVLAARRRLVDERQHDGAARHRRPHHGDLAERQAGQPAASFRSGQPIHSEQFQRLMADNGITCSMSRSGNVWDNAAMESFFSSLKTERTARKVYRTRDEARADVFDYIERFYNPQRRHSTLGYLSPVEFEARWD